MGNKTERIEFRVTESEKQFIQDKANDLGFKSASAFLISNAEDFFTVKLDLSHFKEVSKEVNDIGKNINNLVHHIFAIGVYSDHDLYEIQRLQKAVFDKVNQDYDYLLKLRRNDQLSNMVLKDKDRFTQAFKQQNLDVPKELVLGQVYEQIRNNTAYICQLIEDSPEQEEGISDYVYEYMFDGPLFRLDDEVLNQFSDELDQFSEKMKMKLINVNNVFDDDDWWELKDILDKYEDV